MDLKVGLMCAATFWDFFAKSKVKMFTKNTSTDTNKSSLFIIWAKASIVASTKPRNKRKPFKKADWFWGLREQEGSGPGRQKATVSTPHMEDPGLPTSLRSTNTITAEQQDPLREHWGSYWGTHLDTRKFIFTCQTNDNVLQKACG